MRREEVRLSRRHVLRLALFASAGVVLFRHRIVRSAMAKDTITRVAKTDAQWKAILSPEAYDVLRHEGTEPPWTSPLNEELRKGTFVCAGCGLPLFPSSYKYDSGTGWPSFYDVLDGHVETKQDYQLVLPRTEYHCARCGGHQGHVFDDGPQPTGLRYCNNGAALRFEPEGGAS